MSEIDHRNRANPLGGALDVFRVTLVAFAEQVADRDRSIAKAAFEQARRAAEAALRDFEHADPGDAAASYYDTAVRNALHLRIEAILDEVQAAMDVRQAPPPLT